LRIPPLDPLDEFLLPLARMVALKSFLPHPKVVQSIGRAVFPTVRDQKRRGQLVLQEGKSVGMYDDNVTPTWAILWAHGIVGGSRKGWGFAHVWPASDDMDSYTNLANLAMIPECFGSLTDKDGPLTGYMRWHAWAVYGWKPTHAEIPQIPPDYQCIQWRYFPRFEKPVLFISQRLMKLDNGRVRTLRPLMGMGTLP
jgi:hypothetical protein